MGWAQGSLEFMCCAKLGRRPAQCALAGGGGALWERGDSRENPPGFPSLPTDLSQKVAELETPPEIVFGSCASEVKGQLFSL